MYYFKLLFRGERGGGEGYPSLQGGGVGKAEVGVYLLEVFLKGMVFHCTV